PGPNLAASSGGGAGVRPRPVASRRSGGPVRWRFGRRLGGPAAAERHLCRAHAAGPGAEVAVRRTTVGDLMLPFVIVGLVVYLVFRFFYGSPPPLQYVCPIPIAILAIVEFSLARRVRAVVHHDRDAKPMTAISVARAGAVCKASALVAAGICGAAVGVIARVAPDASTVRAAGNDLRVALLLLVAGGLLVVARLFFVR